MITHYELRTPAEGLILITDRVREAVRASKIKNGIVIVYCPHTTAGMTINENADPDVKADLLLGLDLAFPDRPEFLHAEGNSAAHLKASAVGASVTVLIENGELVLGTWQGIWFCEFDGPRNRRYFVKIIGD